MIAQSHIVAILVAAAVVSGSAQAGADATTGVCTLEDLYGESGSRFQGSIGLWTFEAGVWQDQPRPDYGVGIDDVVVEWREYALVQDDTDCAGGSCAVLGLVSNNVFEGSTLLTITVLDASPDAENDCDLDGTPDATDDCDGNGVRDVVARATSDAEVHGEVVVLDATASAFEFKGDLPVSAHYDSPRTLFIAAAGHDTAEVRVTYRDNDDGSGQVCRNRADPGTQGLVRATATIRLVTANLVVANATLDDNGDRDGIADTNETVTMRILVSNKSGRHLTGLTAHLATEDPKIDCILDSRLRIGELAAGGQNLTSEAFTFRVGDVDRTLSGVTDLDEFSAEFRILFSADQFDATVTPQTVTLDLDLDAIGGSGPMTYFEGFESGTFGTFTTMNLDAGRNSVPDSDGFRCQYSDPDWVGSNSYGAITDCHLGASASQADTYFWQVHAPSAIDGGKAYSGSHSLYMGIFGPASDEHTTPMAVLEAIRTIDPINLGFSELAPELSLKQQVDFLDSKNLGAPPTDAPDRGIVALQLADADDQPVGDWIKLEPYLNVYDQRGIDNYFNCVFDPVDDGNTEDDFFDPTDPNRRLGPSSTCMPERSFVYQGETFFPFDEHNLGNASDGPGLAGSLGIGTWIESSFKLDRFRGRRVRLRFLNTSLKASSFQTWESIFSFNPSPGDDGWWIDDVTVSNALSEPVTILNDDKDNSALPGCGNICNTIIAGLGAEPPGVLRAPGRVLELSALDSVADRCLDGVLQFRYWLDRDGDGDGGGAQDQLLRGWIDDPFLLTAPRHTAIYVVEVRCSTATACIGSAALTVPVVCPSSGYLSFPKVVARTPDALSWSDSRIYDFAEGRLADMATYTTTDQGQSLGPASSFSIAGAAPATGSGNWYLFRASGELGSGATDYCNAPGITWGQNSRDGVLP